MDTIKGNNFIARYDSEKNVLYGIFGAEANGQTTTLLYIAMLRLVREHKINTLQGIEFDLRRVESFSRDHLASMQRESFRFNAKRDMPQVPIAYIVGSEIQENIANLIIQMTPDKDRSDIVFSSAEAIAFFVDWHTAHNAQT